MKCTFNYGKHEIKAALPFHMAYIQFWNLNKKLPNEDNEWRDFGLHVNRLVIVHTAY